MNTLEAQVRAVLARFEGPVTLVVGTGSYRELSKVAWPERVLLITQGHFEDQLLVETADGDTMFRIWPGLSPAEQETYNALRSDRVPAPVAAAMAQRL